MKKLAVCTIFTKRLQLCRKSKKGLKRIFSLNTQKRIKNLDFFLEFFIPDLDFEIFELLTFGGRHCNTKNFGRKKNFFCHKIDLFLKMESFPKITFFSQKYQKIYFCTYQWIVVLNGSLVRNIW